MKVAPDELRTEPRHPDSNDQRCGDLQVPTLEYVARWGDLNACQATLSVPEFMDP